MDFINRSLFGRAQEFSEPNIYNPDTLDTHLNSQEDTEGLKVMGNTNKTTRIPWSLLFIADLFPCEKRTDEAIAFFFTA
jgi:hypothetical protein